MNDNQDHKSTGGVIIGAEVMCHSGATAEKADYWFGLLKQYGMPLARVFVPRKQSDLLRMDTFFDAATRHGVTITATLGGEPTPENAQWIQEVVARYKDHPALDSWILMNEPGKAPEATPLAIVRYRQWLREKYATIEAMNTAWQSGLATFDEISEQHVSTGGGLWSAPGPFLDWYEFWRNHLAWHLEWIANEVRKVDQIHPLHTNPHALAGNLAPLSFDLPRWRTFLDSLGCSIHPSWHLPLFTRDQFAFGYSYICDLIRGAIEPKPFWITELQAGNNTHSGNRPVYPFPEDIAQWLWLGVGSGTQRMIFWLLNNRMRGGESGEWSLLDFQDCPSERLETAGAVATVLRENADFFSTAAPAQTAITLLLSNETMALQERQERTQAVNCIEGGTSRRLLARSRDAHVLELHAMYQTLSELGLPVKVKHISDFDWQANGAKPQLAVLPNVSAMSLAQAVQIEAFVRAGNTILMTGMTGAWDPEHRFWPLSGGFPLEKLIGATLRDMRACDEGCEVHLQSPQLTLPSSLWVGEIRNHTAQVIGTQRGWITAVRAQAGKGTVVWIPSPIGLGAWEHGNTALAALLGEIASPVSAGNAFYFKQHTPHCLLRVLQSGSEFITILSNSSSTPLNLDLACRLPLKPQQIWPPNRTPTPTSQISLPARGTLVHRWSR